MILAVALLAFAAIYVGAARRAPGWAQLRTAAFLLGLAWLAGSLLSPLHAAGEERLAWHMVQHLLLTLVAAPLLVLGRPFAVLLRGGPADLRRPLATLLRARAVAVLVHPVSALALFAGVLLISHLPAFYDAALRVPALHDLEHVAYLASSLLFWQVVLAPAPHPRAVSPLPRMLLVLVAMVPMAVVGVGLLIAGDVVYPTYARLPEALADQRLGGSIMWLWGTLALAVAVVAAGWWAVVREHRRQLTLERSAR